MRIPERWLRAYCNPSWSSDELADALTMAGLEVEESETFAPAFSGVVIAQIRTCRPHPNADRLKLCEVDTGRGVSEIVCGAPNAVAGMRVPCALPGARLPGDFEIKPVKMRGVLSNGMLCSARELGLSDDHSGLMRLADDAPLGNDLREHLALDERILTLKLTPNLGHCLSITGVARELAAISGAELELPTFAPVAPVHDETLPVRIEHSDLCGRFSGRIIRNVDATAPTPAWMRERLERAGQRSISALVDISNYVMLELGRPSHIFDRDRLHGGMTVRWAREGETLELLNGQTVTLDPRFGVIADERTLESLAGIMGGQATAVDDATRNIYVEAAFWWPAAIAGRSRVLNFSTDAGYRFERGVDAATTVEHIEYLTSLILNICGGEPGPIDDQAPALPRHAPVSLRFERARKVIGVAIDDDVIVTMLERLGLAVLARDADAVTVSIPSRRFDLTLEEDLIEEVARLYGYQRLPVRAPMARAAMSAVPGTRRRPIEFKRAVAARDFQEVINYSFVDGALDERLGERKAIALLNPIAQTMNVMRTHLWAGLVQTLTGNLNRRSTRVRLFEVGRVFWADAGHAAGPLDVAGIDQPERIAWLAYGGATPEQWGLKSRSVDFFDLKADVEAVVGEGRFEYLAGSHPALHPGRSARIRMASDGRDLGWIGMLHPAHQQSLELPGPVVLAELALAPLLERSLTAFAPMSKFPPSIRDLAIVVEDQAPAAHIEREIREIAAKDPRAACIKNIRLFDEYRGKGLDFKEKSLAFRLWMQDTERTLEEAEVSAAIDAVLAGLGARFAARLR
ncbi:MAG: phenylalanine--tRNA ligase subunit beta [Burkholderiaceae bacterium]